MVFPAYEYWSRTLTCAEKQFASTETDGLDVVWVVLLLQVYMETSYFIISTEQEAFNWSLALDNTFGQTMKLVAVTA